MTLPQTPREMTNRLHGMFLPAYLTLMSVIGGVALAALNGEAQAHRQQNAITPTQWVLVLATFLLYLAIWNEYVMGVVIYVWFPSLLDAAFPFAWLIVELVLCYAIFGGVRGYLLAFAIAVAMGPLNYLHISLRVRRSHEDQLVIHRLLHKYRQFRFFVGPIIFLTILLLAWGFYDALGLGKYEMVVAVVILVMVVVVLASSVPYWNIVLNYARSSTSHQQN
ncbi:MAG TPA: hypothetical protein VHR15_07370 [Ktedonobacterales bacterium]|jgi:hypothetical protein|nr:hypothetical protein [Ktedonobacterales bacterium]